MLLWQESSSLVIAALRNSICSSATASLLSAAAASSEETHVGDEPNFNSNFVSIGRDESRTDEGWFVPAGDVWSGNGFCARSTYWSCSRMFGRGVQDTTIMTRESETVILDSMIFRNQVIAKIKNLEVASKTMWQVHEIHLLRYTFVLDRLVSVSRFLCAASDKPPP